MAGDGLGEKRAQPHSRQLQSRPMVLHDVSEADPRRGSGVVGEESDPTMILDSIDRGLRSFPDVEDQADTGGRDEYRLVVEEGQQQGWAWPLPPGVTRVGRHPANDITLDHITVSRRHCRIYLDPSGLSIEDLGSTNGTRLNDRLVERTRLVPDDRLMIGTFHLLVARGR